MLSEHDLQNGDYVPVTLKSTNTDPDQKVWVRWSDYSLTKTEIGQKNLRSLVKQAK